MATRYSINFKTAAKWRKRPGVLDARMGPTPVPMVLSAEQEAIDVAFRRHARLVLCRVPAAVEHILQRTLAGAGVDLLIVPTLDDAAALAWPRPAVELPLSLRERTTF